MIVNEATQARYHDVVKFNMHKIQNSITRTGLAPFETAMMLSTTAKPYSGTIGRAEGTDISHWEDWYDPSIARYRTDFAIMKLTEGTTFVDPSAAKIWLGVKQLPIRGAYHYLRSGQNWKQQADFFLAQVAKYDFNLLAVDVEGINNDLTNQFFVDARMFYDYLVEKTGLRVVLYTNKNYLQNYMYPLYESLGGDWVAWLNAVQLWYAQYYFTPSPDKNPSMASQRNPNNWAIYQYTEAGAPDDWGAGGYVDLNVFNGNYEEMMKWADASYVPPEPLPPGSFDWQQSPYHKAIEHCHGWDTPLNFEYHISRVMWVNIEKIITSSYKQFTNHYFLETRGVDLSINSDEYYYPGYDPVTVLTAKGITCEQGVWKQKKGWQAAQFSRNNEFLGISTQPLDGCWNTFAGSNWLVENGAPNTVVDDTSVDPRTILAGDTTYLYFVSIMGRNNGSMGVTRRKIAKWLADNLHVWFAQNGDGGDSTSKNERGPDGKAVNLILNPGDGVENSVGGHFGIIVKKGGDVIEPLPPEGDKMYTVLVDVNIREQATMFSNSIGRATAGTQFDSNIIVTGVPAPAGKTPALMTFVGYNGGYIPEEYDGVKYLEYTAPPQPDETMTITAGTLNITLPDGTDVVGEITEPCVLKIVK